MPPAQEPLAARGGIKGAQVRTSSAGNASGCGWWSWLGMSANRSSPARIGSLCGPSSKEDMFPWQKLANAWRGDAQHLSELDCHHDKGGGRGRDMTKGGAHDTTRTSRWTAWVNWC